MEMQRSDYLILPLIESYTPQGEKTSYIVYREPKKGMIYKLSDSKPNLHQIISAIKIINIDFDYSTPHTYYFHKIITGIHTIEIKIKVIKDIILKSI